MKVEVTCADLDVVNTKTMAKKRDKAVESFMGSCLQVGGKSKVITDKYPILKEFGFEVSKNGKAFIKFRGVKDIVRLSRALDCNLIFNGDYQVVIYDDYIE